MFQRRSLLLMKSPTRIPSAFKIDINISNIILTFCDIKEALKMAQISKVFRNSFNLSHYKQAKALFID